MLFSATLVLFRNCAISRRLRFLFTDVTQKSFLTHPQPLSLSPHAHTQRGAARQVPSVRCSRDDERGFRGVSFVEWSASIMNSPGCVTSVIQTLIVVFIRFCTGPKLIRSISLRAAWVRARASKMTSTGALQSGNGLGFVERSRVVGLVPL